MLTLPITRKWFDMILSGEKTEEYREVKPYYDSRFRRLFDMDESNQQDWTSSQYYSATDTPIQVRASPPSARSLKERDVPNGEPNHINGIGY